MKFRRKSFGGTRPVFTVQPIMVTGGFNLNDEVQKLEPNMIVPAGTLAQYDEENRTVVVLKTATIKEIDASDAKIITLESDEFLAPIFCIGDKVVKTVAGTFDDAPAIKSISNKEDGYIITLDKEITGLAVEDLIMQVVKDESDNAALVSKVFPSMVIKDTTVTEDEVNIDVTVDTGAGAAYVYRIPPIPENFKEGNFLADNPNIKLSRSY